MLRTAQLFALWDEDLIVNYIREVKGTLQKLNARNKGVGLKINGSKTKVMEFRHA